MIKLNGINAAQGDFLLDVGSLNLKKGDFVAVLGNNGSGKSTFLSVLSGLKSFEGSYEIAGEEFGDMRRTERNRMISFLPQSTALNMPFDAFYVVLTGRFIYTDGWSYSDADIEATENIMKTFDVGHLMGRQFNELSGGEKQRVLLARTLNRNSPILLLDEPLSGIDLKHQHESIGLLKEMSAEKIVMVVIHDLSLAIREFERFLFFIDGHLSYDVKRDGIREERLTEVFGVQVNFLRHDKGLFIYTEHKSEVKTGIQAGD